MTSINHALTGALVAAAIHNPWLGLPAAFLSHFVIDIIPHWNYFADNFIRKQAALLADITISLGLLLVLGLTVDAPPRLIIAGGIIGIVPDLMWAPYLITGKPSKTNKQTPLHLARRVHFWVQIKEFSKGLYIEIAWLALMLIFIFHIHR